MHDPEYLRLARALCDRFEVHLIADEIAVGCGRSGSFFAHEQAGIRPDFLCLSKGISGGYLPLSLVLATDAVYADFYDDDIARGFLHSHSYSGNPLACRAALATLDIFDEDNVIAANRARAEALTAALAPLAGHPRVRHFRQRGMIWAFDVAAAGGDFARRCCAAAWDDRKAGLTDKTLSLRKIDFAARHDNKLGLNAGDGIFGACSVDVLRTQKRHEPVAKRGVKNSFLGMGCGIHTSAQKRSARPEDSSGCGVYSPGVSPQRRGVGNIFVGFESCSGSKAQRTRCIVIRSGSANIFDIIFFLSTPTPCSPVWRG
jgi:hypothetical protein